MPTIETKPTPLADAITEILNRPNPYQLHGVDDTWRVIHPEHGKVAGPMTKKEAWHYATILHRQDTEAVLDRFIRDNVKDTLREFFIQQEHPSRN